MKALLTAAALAALAMTSACGGPKEEPPVETNVVNIAEPENIVVANIADEMPAPPPSNVSVPERSTGEFSDDATTQSDAEAAGMTARVDRGENSTRETE